MLLNTYGPRLKDCRGDELEGKIHRGFPILLFRFLIEPFRNEGLGDDRAIQG